MAISEEHQQRAHAVLSASGFKKWATCTMSPAVEVNFEEEDSEWSQEGTYAHGLGELMLRCWLSGNDDGDVAELDTYCDEAQNPEARWHTEEMVQHVGVYVNHVMDVVTALRETYGEDNVLVLLEQRLDFSRWVPEGFGTGDCVVAYPGGIIVIDLKYGAGVLVKDFGQLRLYALGAYERYAPLYEPVEITCSIVQPRKENLRTETIDVEELLTWADELVVPRARIAWAAYNGDRKHASFSPGVHCSEGFCKARYTCAARARFMLEATEYPYAKDAPDVLTVEQLEGVVDKARLAVKWLSDCERYLTEQAVEGKVKLVSHELAEGKTARKIANEDKAARLLMTNGFAASDIYQPPKLVGLVALEQLVGKKELVEVLGDVLVKPEGKPKLIPKREETTPRRKRHGPPASSDFDEFDDE
jgi:hypothetical protein